MKGDLDSLVICQRNIEEHHTILVQQFENLMLAIDRRKFAKSHILYH